ncbi:MAG: 16S rRNA (guanine(966)-N(2))-methyltransferase RsmD [Proteobacteria bacterium]|nr:16S rRNA (guanine(966)-N(2))-methyltransferase RsmD [Pseudomonadota bacterium]
MGQVRIIGGQWRRRTLQVPDRPGLRPTPDRARETVFNWLESWLPYQWSDTRVLDAFAGSGALGIESASRGAQQVVLVESDRVAAAFIQSAIDELHAGQLLRLFHANLAGLAKGGPEGPLGGLFDLVFLDPPFQDESQAQALALIRPLLAPEAMVVLESPRAWPECVTGLEAGSWQCHRQASAGKSHQSLLSLSSS